LDAPFDLRMQLAGATHVAGWPAPNDRTIRYTMAPYAANDPHGDRYEEEGRKA